MEVHKDPHHVTHKKKWGEYLLEFIMLFLAVFLGFVAENIRETSVEHEREKEYMITMMEDLKADIPLLVSTEKDWEESNNSADSVKDAITFPIATADFTKAYRHINEALNYWSFKYNDRTTVQLKNAGGFRLLRNKKVANDSMISKNKIPLQPEVQSALMFEFKNALLSYKQDYINNMKGGYDNLLKYQQELITLISKEYNLE
jgi:hypothetical protein